MMNWMTEKHKGQCVKGCNRPNMEGRAVCVECYRLTVKEGYWKRKVRRAIDGLCSKCEHPPIEGKTLCEKHARQNRESKIRCTPTPKRVLHCSECGGERHNVRSCPKNPDRHSTQ